MASLTSSSIGRKYAMALSAFFLLSFLILHLVVNLLSLFGPTVYNNASNFMGYNPLVQFVMQPILVAGVIFHFVMGFVLEIRNNAARPVKYGVNNPSENSTWMSRNMIISGLVILAFLGLHMYDFWYHEMSYKYIEGLPVEQERFWTDLHSKFQSPIRTGIYIISFILLGLHLAHGFQSSFQSVGARHPKYTPALKAFGNWFSIIIPAGFIVIALFHFLTQ
ncbi:succinate dehydrogenase cytochrome b subunit [Frigoriflavimonas asaccharolytica]|uniref:Succinate dehydrogenase / fumarate reductase cytochrome b subunit n=1 Tax=Frigoriflavimonas asaccharolytica TaxID=2735899 RepID=A0A8J8GA87_9FLAO|nr:succinate dehydrogenase cytochrome b subunit [Frigoriflavimonas asaccharolytica]NRS93923.1 succinate dehydrogenase / fumarate reductase cytochrome b subunit [Frigoriflavimonas asaccharolytica]